MQYSPARVGYERSERNELGKFKRQRKVIGQGHADGGWKGNVQMSTSSTKELGLHIEKTNEINIYQAGGILIE